jgi:hypothetical protein
LYEEADCSGAVYGFFFTGIYQVFFCPHGQCGITTVSMSSGRTRELAAFTVIFNF